MWRSQDIERFGHQAVSENYESLNEKIAEDYSTPQNESPGEISR